MRHIGTAFPSWWEFNKAKRLRDQQPILRLRILHAYRSDAVRGWALLGLAFAVGCWVGLVIGWRTA